MAKNKVRKGKKRKQTTAMYFSVDLNKGARIEDGTDQLRLAVARARVGGQYKGMILDIKPFLHPAYEMQVAIAQHLANQNNWNLVAIGDVKAGRVTQIEEDKIGGEPHVDARTEQIIG